MMEDVSKPKPMQALLKGKGMNMKQLSQVSGIPYRTIQDWNRHVNRPSLDSAVILAKTLNCSLIEVAEAFGCDVKGLPYA